MIIRPLPAGVTGTHEPSYDAIHTACVQFVNHYQSMYGKPEVVVGVARGGLIPAVIISHCLNVPLKAVEYSSSKGKGDDKNHVNALPMFDINKKRPLLIVDDICDSGHTLKEIVEYYRQQGYLVHDFALFFKRRDEVVHYPTIAWVSINEDSPWVIFPYEKTEGVYDV